jgi:hypothetical protein
MQIRITGVYSKQYRTVKGDLRIYHCDRATGERLADDPESMACLERLREIRNQPKAPPVADRTLGALMKTFKGSLATRSCASQRSATMTATCVTLNRSPIAR